MKHAVWLRPPGSAQHRLWIVLGRLLSRALLAAVLTLPPSPALGVDEGRLLSAHQDHDNWLTYGHGYANQRYSGLSQIDTTNVRRLVPKWIYQTGVLGTFPTSPIVADGVMYLTTPGNHVVAPGAGGGANWPPTSYSPQTGWLYVSASHNPTRYTLEPGQAGQPAGVVISFDPQLERWGTLSAVDPRSGKIAWQVKTELPLLSGSVATAGGLIFYGQSNGEFVARRATDGTKLWHFNTGAGVNAPPVSYAVDGKQFVAVASGGHRLFDFPLGDAVIAFGLPD